MTREESPIRRERRRRRHRRRRCDEVTNATTGTFLSRCWWLVVLFLRLDDNKISSLSSSPRRPHHHLHHHRRRRAVVDVDATALATIFGPTRQQGWMGRRNYHRRPGRGSSSSLVASSSALPADQQGDGGSSSSSRTGSPTMIASDRDDDDKNGRTATATIGADGRTGGLSPLAASLTKIGMVSFISLMCILLPATLLPQRLLYQCRIISRVTLNRWALLSSQWCARFAHGLIPFCRIETIVDGADAAAADGRRPTTTPPEPAVWVCNHTSMLDVFILLIVDRRLRGADRRPIKIVYWKQLESNRVTRLMFRTAGFIPIDMAANAPGEENEYDVRGFKRLLKDAKQAMAEGFDIGILPEGQLNPTPQSGLLPIFTGAYTLAKFAKRPIGMIGLFGVDRLWGAVRGMTVLDRRVKARLFGPDPVRYNSVNDFTDAFTDIVGTFGRSGGGDGRSSLRQVDDNDDDAPKLRDGDGTGIVDPLATAAAGQLVDPECAGNDDEGVAAR